LSGYPDEITQTENRLEELGVKDFATNEEWILKIEDLLA